MNTKRVKISNKLKESPSYLKWGKDRLSIKFKCSLRLMDEILKELEGERINYISKFKN